MSPCSIPHLTVCLPGTAGFARLRRWVAVSGLSLPLPKVAEFLIPALQIERQRNYKRNYRTMCSQTAAKAEKPLLFPPHYFPTLSLRWAQGWNESLLGKVTLNRETISWLSCSLCWMKSLIQGTMASAQGELTFKIIKFTWSNSCSLWGKQDEKTVNWFLLILKNYYYLFIFIFAGNSNHSKKNKFGTTVDALGKEDDDDKGVVMWHGPQHPQAGCKGKGSKSQTTRKQVRK